MIERYALPEITKIFGDPHKVNLWQLTELAVIWGRENEGIYPTSTHDAIMIELSAHPCDLVWWRERERETRHDLQAWLDERSRWIPAALQRYWHQGMTSYDTEESASVLMLKQASGVVKELVEPILATLRNLSEIYRHTPMVGRTHGQWADLQTFGKRCLSWHELLKCANAKLGREITELRYSKLSGAVGNYLGVTPDVEHIALDILGLVPYYGATQILPRMLFLPLARSIYDVVSALQQIAIDIRLAARSGHPIVQEPFGKTQTGSSAMPHKKNTINTENTEGMWRLAQHCLAMIEANVWTWEERSIEQSSVERVAWPDLCHVACHALKTMKRVLDGLVVRPDVMMIEILESRGTYAASVAKELLEELGAAQDLTAHDSYRIVQLAAANVFEPSEQALELRRQPPTSIAEAQATLEHLLPLPEFTSIQTLILNGRLRPCEQLAADAATVDRWNSCLAAIFESEDAKARWNQVFQPEWLLRNEATLYRKILGT